MAKPTKFIQLQGKVKWCKLDQPDTKFTPEGRWVVDFYPDQPSLETLMGLKKDGLKNSIKMDEDGSFIKLSRPCQKLIKGRIKAFNPPEIQSKEGNPLPRTTRIGNGSDVTVNVEVYFWESKMGAGCATRLLSVRIEQLVTFTKDDYNREEARLVKGLEKVPPQEPTW